jgi:O-antigen/teichoic acid export membrane protein
MAGATATGDHVAEGSTSDTIQGEQREYLSKVTKEAGYAFFGKIFGLLFGFVAQAIFARLLGADLLGVFVLGWTVVFGVTILTSLGFEGSLVRYLAKYHSSGQPGEARSVLLLGVRLTLVASAAGAVVMVLLREPMANRVFSEPRLSGVLAWISLAVIPYGLMRVLSASLRSLKDIRSFIVGFDVSHRVFRFVLFLILYYTGLRLYGMVHATVGACVLSGGLLTYFLWRGFPFLFDRKVAPAAIPRKEIVAYSGAMLADTFLAFAMQHSGRIVIGIFLESAAVGVFNVAVLLGNLVLLVRMSFVTIFAPVISDLFHRDRFDMLLPLFRSVTRWVIILALPIYLWIVVAGEAVLGVFGPEFVSGYESLLWLATGLMIAGSTGPVGAFLSMTGHQKWNVYNAVALAVISVGLNVALVPRMGITGAGLALGLAQALVNIARLVQVRILLKISPYDRSSLKVAATVVIGLVVAAAARAWIEIPARVDWLLVVAAASVALVALLTMAMGVKEEDRLVLATVLRKVRRSKGND